MKNTLKVINELKEKGLIDDYAICGGIAALFYIEKIERLLEQTEINKEKLEGILRRYNLREKFKLLRG